MVKRYKKRPKYLKKVRPYIDKEIIKVIVGQRRCGKSFLLFQIMDELVEKGVKKENIIYINKELSEFENIQNHQDLLKHIDENKKGRKKHYVFVDEIQEIDGFEKALRHLNAKGNYDLYCTGSNATLLSGELATFLSGRYIEVEVFNLSYIEFLKFHKLKNNKTSFFKYIKYGGLPYLSSLELKDDIAYVYLKNIYNTIVLKDIVARNNIRNVAFLEKLIQYLADNVGSLVSAKKISDFLKSQRTNISPNIVLSYLSCLCNAFLVFKAQRYDVQGKKIFEINEKYYFGDMGLRSSIVGYKDDDINKVLENLVFMHLKISDYDVKIGKLGNREINFVAEKNGKTTYIQVAYLIASEEIREREFGNLLKIKDNYRKIVVSMDDIPSKEYKGVEHIYIVDFLSKYQ